MKFFTLDCWLGEVASDPVPLYANHVALIRDELPPDLLSLTLHQSFTLHDARLRQLSLFLASSELILVFDADDGKGRFQRELKLTYHGVLSIEGAADPTKGLRGRHGYGDLRYDEVDIVDGGCKGKDTCFMIERLTIEAS